MPWDYSGQLYVMQSAAGSVSDLSCVKKHRHKDDDKKKKTMSADQSVILVFNTCSSCIKIVSPFGVCVWRGVGRGGGGGGGRGEQETGLIA